MVCVICGVLPFCLTLGDVRARLSPARRAHLRSLPVVSRAGGGEGGAREAERRAVRGRGGPQTAQESREDPEVHGHNNTQQRNS